MKFLVDYHLQKLGRWLRFLGQDVEILDKRLIPSDLIAKMKSEEYIFLTRDHFWDGRKEIERTHIKSDHLKEQLRQLIEQKLVVIDKEEVFKRCTICNSYLKEVDKEKMKDKIPPKTLKWRDEYWQCPKCQKLYWKGTHFGKIREILKGII